jgi:mRNA interferase YafQ
MLKLRTAKRFEKDYEKALRSGKDEEKIKRLILTLLHGKALEAKYHNHKLKGEYQDRWECHIEPDWLLIYKKTADELILERTGSHSELFN